MMGPMARNDEGLSRREREVMDIIYGLGRVTAAEVRAQMAQPPTDPAVRTTLRILVQKGRLKHESDGPRYVSLPTLPPEAARRSAFRHLLDTFFGGSAHGATPAREGRGGAARLPAELPRNDRRPRAADRRDPQRGQDPGGRAGDRRPPRRRARRRDRAASGSQPRQAEGAYRQARKLTLPARVTHDTSALHQHQRIISEDTCHTCDMR